MRLPWNWERVFSMVESDTIALPVLSQNSHPQVEEIMTAQELSQAVSKLHEELTGNPELDENALRSLSALLGEIQVAIDRAASDKASAVEPQEPSQDVVQRLQSAISEFEAKHPRLTLTLSQIADRLSAMGI
jgi:hypothetical protein